MLGSGNNLSRGGSALSNSLSRGGLGLSSSDVPPLPQCVPLEPIGLGNQKYTRSGEIRRVLGVPNRNSSEDHSFGVAHPKPSPPVATEELKHFKESVQGTSREAGDRAKKLGESIFKLDKYAEALSSKKRWRNDILPGDRSGRVNLEKVRDQIPRNSQDAMDQRIDERKKILGLNKRARTSVADLRADGRIAALSRQQMATEKDDDSLPGVSGDSVRIEEKIRRLPGGGEGWETKMKRKRSVSTLGNRVMNVEQRTMHPKLTADSKMRSCDNQTFRSKSFAGVSGINRLDVSFEPDSPEASTLSRTELENVPLARDRSALVEQRVMAKGNKRNLPDSPVNNSSAMLKGKVSRAPRTGSIMVLDSSSKVEPSSGALQGSSSHAMAQWVGQRPHKNSRTRRTNLVSPVIKHAENKISSQGFAASDFTPRTSPGTTGSLANVDNSNSKVKREPKHVSSPYGFSESEESGAGDNKPRENGIDGGEVIRTHKTKALLLPIRKNKITANQNKDKAWAQGKSESGSSLTTGIYPIIDKMENVPTEKLLQNTKAASDKHKIKSGRPPSKKLKDRKASTRLGSNTNIFASDFTGESDDDHEDLFAAANSARKASYLACSGPFWKKMDYIFAPVSSDDIACMKQQVSLAEELDDSLSEVIAIGCNILGVAVQKDASLCPGGQSTGYSNHDSSKSDPSFERLDLRRLNETAPLYKRVLSALIEEDDGEEVLQHCEGKNMSFHYASDDSHCGSCTHMDTEPKERDRMESEVESNADFQLPKNCFSDRFSCDRSVMSNSFRNPSMSVSVHSNEPWLGDDDLSHSEVGLGSETYSNDVCRIQPREAHVPGFPSSDSQYQLMSLDERVLLELQSIGVYPETLPDLAEEAINADVMELKEEVYQQIRSKKKNLEKVDKTIQKGRDAENRHIEHLALDQLVEMAHRKRMACRGSKGSKIRKVSRQVALAFIKRTVTRCRKLEETGRTCFADPALQDVLFSSPSNEAKSADNVGSGTASNTCNEASNLQTEARGSGAVSSAKRREALIDDFVGSASSRITTSLDSTVPSGGGVHGKRSERNRDQTKDSSRNISSWASRLPLDNSKTEPKPNQKKSSNRASTHPTGPSSRVSSEGATKVGSSKGADEPIDFGSLQLHELDSMDGPQDLGTWLTFDDDGLQDIDTAGLEIPMDDLSELNMLL